MSTGNWLCPVHFACFDCSGNFWHFRNMGPKQLINPFLLYGRIEATLSSKIDRCGRIYQKKILIQINAR